MRRSFVLRHTRSDASQRARTAASDVGLKQPGNSWLARALAAAFIVIGAAVGTSDAQPLSPFYAGAGVGAFSVSADALDGHTASAAFIAGAALRPWLDIEAEVVVPRGQFSRSYGGDALSLSFAGPDASASERDRLGVRLRYDTTRDVDVTLSAVAIVHRAIGPRTDVGLVVGVSGTRVHDRTSYTPVVIGAGVDPNHPSVRARTEATARTIGGPTVGALLAFRVTEHLTVGPDIRYDYGSLGDEINNTLRSSIKLRWRF